MKIKVLIIEDESIIALHIKTFLLSIDYDVVAIKDNYYDSIEFINLNHVDIALVDINIKGDIDGIQTADTIKKFTIFLLYF